LFFHVEAHLLAVPFVGHFRQENGNAPLEVQPFAKTLLQPTPRLGGKQPSGGRGGMYYLY